MRGYLHRFSFTIRLLALFALFLPAIHGVSISNCSNLTSAGENYTLAANITLASSICFRVQAANVTLDCNGFSLTGGNASGNFAIYTNQFNTTIKNCIISNFSTGLYLNRTLNASISNVSSFSTCGKAGGDFNGDGIYMEYANFSTISRVNVSSLASAGIRIVSSSCNNTIISSTAYAGSDIGIYFDSGSNNNTISNTSVSSASGKALGMALSLRNTFSDSTFSSATSYPVWLFAVSNGNRFVNNTFISTGGAANLVFLDNTGGASTGNYFALNNFTSTSGYYVSDASGSNFLNYTVNGINQGNIYHNVMNGSVNISGLVGSSVSGLYVSSTMYNSTSSGSKVTSNIMDYAPLTANPAQLNCSQLSIANAAYAMTSSIAVNGATCLNITAANVTLDCNGHSITGNNSTGAYGIITSAANTTIRNCNVSNFGYGISSYAAGTRITDTNATSSNCNTIDLYNATGAVLNRVNATKLTPTCSTIAITNGANITIENSTLTGVNGIWTENTLPITGIRAVNNTFSCQVQQCISLSSVTSDSYFALNNFTGAGTYAVDNNGSNYYNFTVFGINQGNIWGNVINGSVNISGLSASSISGLYVGTTGSGYPYNSTTSGGKLQGSAVDYAPLTSAQVLPPNISINAPASGQVFLFASGSGIRATVAANGSNLLPDYLRINITGAGNSSYIYNNSSSTNTANCTASGLSLSCNVFPQLTPGNYTVAAFVSDANPRNATATLNFTVSSTEGNSTNITTNLQNATVLINGTEVNSSTAFTGVLTVNITANALPVALFNYNFSYSGLNFSAINMTRGAIGSASYIEISGIPLSGMVGNKNVTIYNASSSYTQVCVLDIAGANVTDITSACTGRNETLLTCDGTVSNGKWCTMSGTTIYLYNLTHSAALQYAPAAAAPSTGGSDYATPFLSYAFNCSSGSLLVSAKRSSEPISGIEIRLKDPASTGWLSSAATGSNGAAPFTITSDGRYSVESVRTTGYFAAYISPFTLSLCQKAETAAPPAQNNATQAQPSAPSQPPVQPQETPKNNAGNNPPSVPPSGQAAKNQTPAESIINETISGLPLSDGAKETATATAAPTLSLATICGGMAIVLIPLAYLLFIRKKKNGL